MLHKFPPYILFLFLFAISVSVPTYAKISNVVKSHKKKLPSTKASKAVPRLTVTKQKQSTKTSPSSKTRSLKKNNQAKAKAIIKNGRAKKNKTKISKIQSPLIHEVFTDTLYSEGLRYRHFLFGRQKHSVHVAEISTVEPSLKVGIIKGLGRIDGLERLGDMSIRHDSTSRDTLYVGINANFWRAYRNTPIGPMVSGGEVVHLHSYKQWSSAFFDSKNRMTIDQFILTGRVKFNGHSANIDFVNERNDSTGIVVYNSFAGNSVPFVSPVDLEKAALEFIQNHSMNTDDSTETGLNMQTLREELTNAKREASIEFPMKKVKLRYLRNPVINREIPCLVRGIDSGEVQMPIRGCILSFGNNYTRDQIPQKGDTVYMRFTTNVADSIPFTTAVSGTPRMVRNGKAQHEAMIEGSHAKRFLNKNLARTAIGTDRTRSKNYFVMVEANNEKGKGATLAQMAVIMKSVGAWNAINLDGGGSAMMIVCGANACTNSTVPSGRKISAALGVFRRQRPLKSTGKTLNSTDKSRNSTEKTR
ncbi:MAG: phosphodiester glycosidase family protein [Ignavibacteria bacterium]|nr:phosphodiester glycosidase family protein [Ignavibacteria bacterium]